jgi:hypothetical protein
MLDLLGISGGSIWAAVLVVVGLLATALGIQSKRLSSAKKKADEKEEVIQHLSQQAGDQNKVLKKHEEEQGKIVKQKGEVLEEIVPEIKEIQNMPEEDKKELSPTIKKAAKSQVERINKRRANK